MQTTITVNAPLLAAAQLFTAKNDVRYYLEGIYFEPTDDGAIVCATNGHYLFVARDSAGTVDNPPESDLIVQLPQTGIIPALKKAETAQIQCNGELGPNGTQLATLTAGTVTHQAHMIDGRFPDWRMVMRDNAPEMAQAYDPAYLAVICAAAKILKRETIQIAGTGKDSAANFSFGAADDWEAFAVLMPCRGDSKFTGLPAWTHKAAKLEAVA